MSEALAAVAALEALPADLTDGTATRSGGSESLNELRLLCQRSEAYLDWEVDERGPIRVLRQRADGDAKALRAFVHSDWLQKILPMLGAWADRDDPTGKVNQELWNLTHLRRRTVDVDLSDPATLVCGPGHATGVGRRHSLRAVGS